MNSVMMKDKSQKFTKKEKLDGDHNTTVVLLQHDCGNHAKWKSDDQDCPSKLKKKYRKHPESEIIGLQETEIVKQVEQLSGNVSAADDFPAVKTKKVEKEAKHLTDSTIGKIHNTKTAVSKKGILKRTENPNSELEIIRESESVEVSLESDLPKPKKIKLSKKARNKLKIQLEKKSFDVHLQYLRDWKLSRDTKWSFQKVRQVWLLRNWRDTQAIPDDDFQIFLEYIVRMKGGSRDKTAEDAKKIIAEVEDRETYGAADEIQRKIVQRAHHVIEALTDK